MIVSLLVGAVLEDVNEFFVRNLYRGVLKREPDEEGFQHYFRLLEGDPSISTAGKILLTLIESAENKRMRVRRADRFINEPHPVQVISIGSCCITSQVLKDWGLKKWSGPFDWIFSNMDMVIECIREKFELFLDRSMYYPTQDILFGTGHTKYREKYGFKIVFNHHNLIEDDQYAYMTRCVSRFLKALSDEKPTLLIGVFTDCNDQQFSHLCQTLEAYPTVTVVCFLVRQRQSFPLGIGHIRELGRHSLVELNLLGGLIGDHFDNPGDEDLLGKSILHYRATTLEESEKIKARVAAQNQEIEG